MVEPWPSSTTQTPIESYERERQILDKKRTCDDKEKLDRANAESRALRIRKRERSDKCRAYQCPHCRHWHIGHQR